MKEKFTPRILEGLAYALPAVCWPMYEKSEADLRRQKIKL
jgi:hypothetical protein